MKTAKFVIEYHYKGFGEFGYSFTLKSSNGKTLAVSEAPYTRKHSCKRAIAAMQRALGTNLEIIDKSK